MLYVCPGQWSPSNQEGHRRYGREFLLQLRDASASLKKPSDLPKLPAIILDQVSVSLFVSTTRLFFMSRDFKWHWQTEFYDLWLSCILFNQNFQPINDRQLTGISAFSFPPGFVFPCPTWSRVKVCCLPPLNNDHNAYCCYKLLLNM